LKFSNMFYVVETQKVMVREIILHTHTYAQAHNIWIDTLVL